MRNQTGVTPLSPSIPPPFRCVLAPVDGPCPVISHAQTAPRRSWWLPDNARGRGGAPEVRAVGSRRMGLYGVLEGDVGRGGWTRPRNIEAEHVPPARVAAPGARSLQAFTPPEPGWSRNSRRPCRWRADDAGGSGRVAGLLRTAIWASVSPARGCRAGNSCSSPASRMRPRTGGRPVPPRATRASALLTEFTAANDSVERNVMGAPQFPNFPLLPWSRRWRRLCHADPGGVDAGRGLGPGGPRSGRRRPNGCSNYQDPRLRRISGTRISPATSRVETPAGQVAERVVQAFDVMFEAVSYDLGSGGSDLHRGRGYLSGNGPHGGGEGGPGALDSAGRDTGIRRPPIAAHAGRPLVFRNERPAAGRAAPEKAGKPPKRLRTQGPQGADTKERRDVRVHQDGAASNTRCRSGRAAR